MNETLKRSAQRTASPKRESNRSSQLGGSGLRGAPQTTLEPLPSFNEVPKDVWPRLVSQKLTQVKAICDFSAEASPQELRNQEIKLQALQHMIEYLALKQEGFAESNYPLIIETFAKNVLRPVPPATNPVGQEYDPEEDEDVLEASWPHLNLVYDMFVKFLELPDFSSTVARRHIDQAFVVQLMALFDVEDPRERDLVKTTLHRVYGKFLHLRPVIRKLMRCVFTEVICEDVPHKIAEMLEILGSVINGFALPIREEHRIFLERTLVPLHKARNLPCFFQQLCFCVTQFVEKDASMCQLILPGLFRIWPKTNTNKEVLFLTELEEILLRLDPSDFQPVAGLVFDQLARCLGSQHFQVAEKTLMLWHSEEAVELLLSQPEMMLRYLTPALLRHGATHWNQNVKMLILGLIKTFVELNPALFELCATDYAQRYHVDLTSLLLRLEKPSEPLDAPPPTAPSESEPEMVPEPTTDEGKPRRVILHVEPPQSKGSMRRKSVLPSDAEVAAALANYRPSPPPAPLPGD